MPTPKQKRLMMGGNQYATLPQNLLLDPTNTLFEDFEAVWWNWNVTNGAVAANTTQFKTGTQSIKLTSDPGAISNIFKVCSYDLSSDWQGLSYWVYVHNTDPADMGAYLVMLQLVNDAGWNNMMSHVVTPLATWVGMNGWHRFYIPKNYFHQIGAGTFADPIIRVCFTLRSAAGKSMVVSFEDAGIGEKRLPAIMPRFDDGYIEHYSIAYAYMKPRGLRGTVYCITANVGTPGYMTWNQLSEMSANGWIIANHTRSHASLLGHTVADQQTAIGDGMNDLAANGFASSAVYLAYPIGEYDANTWIAMTNLGVVIGHSGSFSISVTDADPSGYWPQVLPDLVAGNNFVVKIANHASTTPLAIAKSIVDITIANGTILSPLFHQINGVGQFTTADFQSYIDYVYAKAKAGLIYPITIDDYYNLTLGPVRVPRIR